MMLSNEYDKKAPTKLGTASVAQTFRLDAGLHHNFKKGVRVHFEFGPSARQQSQTLQMRVITRSVVSLLLLLGSRILFIGLFRSVPRFSLNFRK